MVTSPYTPASFNLVRRQAPLAAPVPEREAAQPRPPPSVGSPTRQAEGRDAGDRASTPSTASMRRKTQAGSPSSSKARTVRQTAERSRTWAALSATPQTANAFLTAAEEKTLAGHVKELQRIEGVREELRKAASRSLIKLMQQESAVDGPTIVWDTEPKPAELARACAMSAKDLQTAVEVGKRAREQLVRKNMPLVAQMATQYAHQGKLSFEDIVQEGAKGLLRAAELFDPRKGHRFTTYAYRWIQVHVSRACQNHGRTVRVPVHIYERLPALARAKAALVRSLGRPPTTEEVAEHMKIQPSEVQTFERAYANEESLDLALQISRGFKGGRAVSLEDSLESSDDSRGIENDIENDVLVADLKSLLSTLLPKERYVLTQYFGVGGNEPRSFKMQAKEIGVSVRVIERIASRGLEKLRHPSRAAYLLPFLDMPGLGNGGGLDSED